MRPDRILWAPGLRDERKTPLRPGDVVLTGTPPGARFLAPSDRTEITIEPIGRLANPWVAETG